MCYRVLHQINLFLGIGVPCFLFAPHMVPYGEYTAQKVYTDRYCTQVYSLLCCFLSLCLLLSRDFPSMVCVWYDYPTLHSTAAKTALQDNMGKSCMVVCS